MEELYVCVPESTRDDRRIAIQFDVRIVAVGAFLDPWERHSINTMPKEAHGEDKKSQGSNRDEEGEGKESADNDLRRAPGARRNPDDQLAEYKGAASPSS